MVEGSAAVRAELAAKVFEATRTVELQRLHNVLEMLPVYVILLSPDYRVPFENRFFRERFGESQGRRCFEYLFGRSEPCEICETYTVLRTNQPHRWKWTGPDGRDYDIFDFPFASPDGSPLIMEVGVDITEAKRAEAALREAQALLEVRVQERTAELADAKSRQELLAEVVGRLLGSEDPQKIVEDLARSVMERLDCHVFFNFLVEPGMFRLRLNACAGIPEEAAREIELLDYGVAVCGCVARDACRIVAEDIPETPDPRTELIKSFGVKAYACHPLMAASEVLGTLSFGSRTKSRFAAGDVALMQEVTNHIAIAMARVRAEGRIRQQNATLEGINRILSGALGCDTEEELGRICLSVAEQVTGSKFGFIGEVNAEGRLDDVAISDPGWAACRLGGLSGGGKLPAGLPVHGIYGRVLLDGKGFYTNDPASHPDHVGVPAGHPPLKAFLGAPISHAGKPSGILAVANRQGGYRPQDLEALEALALATGQVLTQKRAEQAVRAGEERLRQAQRMESIGLLAGGVAHDFNNLLAAILGNASLLNDEVAAPSREKVDAVIKATEKAADLTRQLLAYAGRGRFIIEPLDASTVVLEMTDLLRASVSKKIDLQFDLREDLPSVEADRGQLQQILMNLVLNAAEAIGPDLTGTVTVRTSARDLSREAAVSDEITKGPIAPGRYVCLEVVDDGCGMDKATRSKVFDPFFTTKFVGRGLGLAAVAGIVQAHRGGIQLETAPAKGARFRVFLPAGAAAPLRARKEQPDAAQHGRGTVLVVDDEKMIRGFVRQALERQGYRVLEAQDGAEAVQVFRENARAVSVVLLDLTMPVMSGKEAIELLRNEESDVKAILMSGYNQSEAMKAFAGKAASGFLQKPFTPARLGEEVRKVIAHSAPQ